MSDHELLGGINVAMLGARMHYAIPRILEESGILSTFFTDLYVGNKPLTTRLLSCLAGSLGSRGVHALLGRDNARIPPSKVVSFDALGVAYALSRRRARSQADTQRIYLHYAAKFGRSINRHGFGSCRAVWGFDGASAEIFTAAKSAGLLCILEQSILPINLHYTWLAAEWDRFGTWVRAASMGKIDPALLLRERREWDLADYIFAPSRFVADGLVISGVPPDKVRIVPYGVDFEQFHAASDPVPYDGRRKLRVLFAGEVGLRKGAPDLLLALRLLNHGTIECRFAGTNTLSSSVTDEFTPVATFLGAVPRTQMPGLYQWADVFVLPTLLEGSATVTYEAMLSGLPVITTTNAGSLVEDGRTGFIVPVRSPDAIARCLLQYIQNPALLQQHRNAVSGVRRNFSFERYKDEVMEHLESILSIGAVSPISNVPIVNNTESSAGAVSNE